MSSLYLCAFVFAAINPFISKKAYKYYLWAILAVLVFHAYHLKVTESMDLYRTLSTIELYGEVGWDWVAENRLERNPLTTVLFYVFSLFDDPMLLPAFTAFVCYGLAFSLLLKCAKRYDLTKGQMNCLLLIFCMCFYYEQAISNVRIYLCYALISYFMYCEIIDGKFKKISWLVYIACCFIHYAVAPFLLFRMLIVLKKKSKESGWAVLAISVIVFLAGDFLISRFSSLGGFFGTLAEKNEGYQNYEVFGIWQFLSTFVRIIGFTGIYAYVYKNSCHEEKRIILYLACVNIMLFVMFDEFQLVLRTPNFMHYLGMLPLAKFFKTDPSPDDTNSNMIKGLLSLYLFFATAYTIWYQVMWTYPAVSFEF